MPQTAVGVARNASPKYVWDQYPQSVAISPYLVAIMVSNYGFTEAFTQQGVPYRSWYTKKMLNQTQYATQAGLKIMNYLQENIFKPSYPIDKMDQIAKADFHQLLAHLAHMLQPRHQHLRQQVAPAHSPPGAEGAGRRQGQGPGL